MPKALFETMRSYRGRIVDLSGHLSRMRRSAKALGIAFPFNEQRLIARIRQAVKQSGLKDARLRLTLWNKKRGAGFLIEAENYRPPVLQKYKKGFRLALSPLRQGNLLRARFKTTNRKLFEKSFDYARKKGFDDALIINSRGYISEASRSNIFFAKAGKLFTPALSCGCLEGVTRKIVFDLARQLKIKVYRLKLTLNELYGADEAFLTNSLMGIMPLGALDKKIIGKGKCGKLTKLLQKRYNCLLR